MLVQLSDPHIGQRPDSDERWARAVDRVLALPQRPDAVVVTGDLTEHGSPDEYARVRAVLARLHVPVHVLPGNHDRRDTLRAAFGLAGVGAEPIAGAVRVGPLRLVLGDSIVPGQDAGRLDLAALAGLLAADAVTPTILALHHPPLLLGLPAIDALGLPAADRAGLADLLAAAPNVLRVIAGHVHRTAVGTVGPCPVLALGSTSAQLPLDFTDAAPVPVDEPPLLAVHALVDGRLVSHLQPV